MLYLVPQVLPCPTPQRQKNEWEIKGFASLFLKDNEICTETGQPGKKASDKPEAQTGGVGEICKTALKATVAG